MAGSRRGARAGSVPHHSRLAEAAHTGLGRATRRHRSHDQPAVAAAGQLLQNPQGTRQLQAAGFAKRLRDPELARPGLEELDVMGIQRVGRGEMHEPCEVGM